MCCTNALVFKSVDNMPPYIKHTCLFQGQTTLCYKSDSPMSLSEARSRLHDYLSAQNVSPKSVQLTQDATVRFTDFILTNQIDLGYPKEAT